ncbi:MAG: hypothetical protein J2P54_12620 [Bradyrhizobiaceae bacterium]|nr:hypothetical protein [Bradyrhizobiaceae bacterium]
MTSLLAILRDVTGLFVDDGWLALAILGVVAVAAIVAALTPDMPLLSGAILLLGNLCVLLVNVIRAAR